MGWSLMEAASSHLENSSQRLGGAVFAPRSLDQNHQAAWDRGRTEPGPTTQMHYNKAKVYPGSEVEDERPALHLWLLICQPQSPGSHEVRMIAPWGFKV